LDSTLIINSIKESYPNATIVLDPECPQLTVIEFSELETKILTNFFANKYEILRHAAKTLVINQEECEKRIKFRIYMSNQNVYSEFMLHQKRENIEHGWSQHILIAFAFDHLIFRYSICLGAICINFLTII